MLNLTERGKNIKIELLRRDLSQRWLRDRLEDKHILTDPSQLSSILRGALKSPKAEVVIAVSEEILGVKNNAE